MKNAVTVSLKNSSNKFWLNENCYNLLYHNSLKIEVSVIEP